MGQGAKINTGKLVRKYIGEGLAPFGFVYMGSDKGGWMFEKKMKNGVKQQILLSKYRFAENNITFELMTSVRGGGRVPADALENMIPGLDRYPVVQAGMVAGVESNGYLPGYWAYEDEVSLIETLQVMKEVLIHKCLRILHEMSKPIEDDMEITNEMFCELYFHHAELAERFQKRTGLEAEQMDEVHINQWFDVIAARVEELQKGSYEEAKGELVEMAAFLGVQIERHMRGVWERYMNEGDAYESCSVKIPCYGYGENVLKLLMGGYAGNGIDWTRDRYTEIWRDWKNNPDVRECKIRETSATTKEMHRELYDHHAELAERFQKRIGLEAEQMDEAHINRWFGMIAARAEELQKGSYEDAKGELMEMAAFLGVQIERHMGGVWKLAIDKKDGYKNCYMMEICSKVRINVLDVLVGGYIYNDIEWAKNRYIVLRRVWMDMQEMG